MMFLPAFWLRKEGCKWCIFGAFFMIYLRHKGRKGLKNYEIVKSYPGGEKLPGRGNNAPGKA